MKGPMTTAPSKPPCRQNRQYRAEDGADSMRKGNGPLECCREEGYCFPPPALLGATVPLVCQYETLAEGLSMADCVLALPAGKQSSAAYITLIGKLLIIKDFDN